MGIPRGTARLLLDEARQRPFGGSVLELGRSTVYFGNRDLERWAGAHGVELAAVEAVLPSHDPRLAAQGCIDDTTLFRRLGFSTVESSDIADWEGADHIFDLNRPLPAELDPLRGRFDAVFDPGTMVQVFDVPQVFANIHDLLKVGGRVIHGAIPSNNHVDLGFYMVSPTLFADFYDANGYRLESIYLCEYTPYWHHGKLYTGAWKVYRYSPGSLDHLSYGRYGGAQAAVFAVATKLEGSTGDVVPQLGQYRESWETYRAATAAAGDSEAAAGERRVEQSPLARAFEHRLARHPHLAKAYRPVKRLKEKVRRALPRKMPPLVARY